MSEHLGEHISGQGWEAVIGLEIHVELNTKTKLFSPAPNRFGDEPNSNITEICTGQPGALPVLNREAVHKAVAFGLAIGAHIERYSRFDRKSYFYPDSPRNFQITQFEMPLIVGGSITADVEGVKRSFAITKAHLEDDAGTIKHFASFASVDFNRAGVPLIEIVSEPCLFSAKEAVAYAMAVKAILEYLDVSDCDMEEGSLRFDANISVRPQGEKGLRTKVEIKNMNSFNFLGLAIESEIKRQIQEYTKHKDKDPKEVIVQSTYRWDLEKKMPVLMRLKESAEDYRYFMEPDLPPLILEDEYIDAIRKTLPELPYERRQRYLEKLGLTSEGASVLVNEKQLADYFEEALKSTPHAKALCNWITVEFGGRLKEKGEVIWRCGILPSQIASLVNLIHEGRITGKIAKAVADCMVESPTKSLEAILNENPDFSAIHDAAEIEKVIDGVLAAHPTVIEDYRNGKERAFSFLVGQVMKAMQGKASPQVVNQILQAKLKC